MASFLARVSSMAVLVFIMFLTSHQTLSKKFVNADEKLFRELCSKAKDEGTCIQCVKGGKWSADVDAIGIAIILMDCANFHGACLVQNFTILASQATDERVKNSLLECKALMSAVQDFQSVKDSLYRQDYFDGYLGMSMYAQYGALCRSKHVIDELGPEKVPWQVFDGITVWVNLSEAALKIIEPYYQPS
ncbi:uncharacterized protein LOC113291858 [Papaver somniferum]|uniref:uncharacterized protein LOC113291858 n=1 Tax=Papaver somniferum TaxID=3469 RepID=UPI000E6FC6C6|nr:uncharacterized protein LOC113291858 [Papaver somniferum]